MSTRDAIAKVQRQLISSSILSNSNLFHSASDMVSGIGGRRKQRKAWHIRRPELHLCSRQTQLPQMHQWTAPYKCNNQADFHLSINLISFISKVGTTKYGFSNHSRRRDWRAWLLLRTTTPDYGSRTKTTCWLLPVSHSCRFIY